MHDVFISYSSKDRETAMHICNYLEGNNIKCWLAPRNIEPGREWPSEIVNAIRSAKIFLLISSKHSNVSRHVMSEIAQASETSCTIIPFMIDNTPMSDSMSYYLKSLHWLDCSKMPFEHALVTLYNKVYEVLNGRIFPPPVPVPPKPVLKKLLTVAASIVGVISFLIAGFFLYCIFSDDEPVVPEAENVSFLEISTLSSYRYPFFDTWMFSVEKDLYVVENTDENTYAMIKTDTGYIIDSNLQIDIERYFATYLHTTVDSKYAYFYDIIDHTVQIYNKENHSCSVKCSFQPELTKSEALYNFVFYNNDFTSKNSNPDDMAIIYKDENTGYLSKSIALSPDGNYTINDISQYCLESFVCGVDIPDSSLMLAIDKTNSLAFLDVKNGTVLDLTHKDMRENYFPYLIGESINISPDKKYFAVIEYNTDGTTNLTVWNTESGKPAFSNIFRKSVTHFFTDDGKMLYYTTESENLISVDLMSGKSTTVLKSSFFEENSDFSAIPYNFYYISDFNLFAFSCKYEQADGSVADRLIITDINGNALYKSQLFEMPTTYYHSTFLIDNQKILYSLVIDDLSILDDEGSSSTKIYRALYTINENNMIEFAD